MLFVTADDSACTTSENNAYFLRTALEATGIDLVAYHPPPFNPVEYAMLGALKTAYRLRGQNFQAALSVPAAARRRRHLEDAISRTKPDVVLANSPAVVAGLSRDIPYVVYTDAPIQDLIDMGYYYDNWPDRSRRRFLTLERDSLRNASAVIYHTEWAASQAIAHRLAAPETIHVVYPGANLWPVPRSNATLDRPRGTHCELLFFGRDWIRKGGPIALEATDALTAMGIPARLTIAGPKTLPEEAEGHPNVRHLGRLGKQTPAERAHLEQLFGATDYVIMPTRAEASTSAIRESAAFGVPSIVTDIGGHRDIIAEGRTGNLVPLEANGRAYAEAIRANYLDDTARIAYRREARLMYERHLNWDIAVRNIMSIVSRVACTRQPLPAGPGSTRPAHTAAGRNGGASEPIAFTGSGRE